MVQSSTETRVGRYETSQNYSPQTIYSQSNFGDESRINNILNECQ